MLAVKRQLGVRFIDPGGLDGQKCTVTGYIGVGVINCPPLNQVSCWYPASGHIFFIIILVVGEEVVDGGSCIIGDNMVQDIILQYIMVYHGISWYIILQYSIVQYSIIEQSRVVQQSRVEQCSRVEQWVQRGVVAGSHHLPTTSSRGVNLSLDNRGGFVSDPHSTYLK